MSSCASSGFSGLTPACTNSRSPSSYIIRSERSHATVFVGSSRTVDTTGVFAPLAFVLAGWAAYVSGVTQTSDGTPLPNLTVTNDWESVTSDDTGHFRIGGATGDWYLSGNDVAGYYPASFESHYTAADRRHGLPITVTADTTQNLTYTLMPRLALGALRDANGDGVPNVEVTYTLYSQDWNFGTTTSVFTGADGTYTVRAPYDVNYLAANVNGAINGYGQAQKSIYLYPDPSTTTAIALDDITFPGPYTVPVSGTVSDGNGTPIVNALVRAQLAGGGANYDTVETYTAADGTYTLYGLAGNWAVYVYDNTGTYTVTVTQHWTATYNIAGTATGHINDVLHTANTMPLPVHQAQAVVDG